jgi:drug/metabolite transporter (DMT)-like permease
MRPVAQSGTQQATVPALLALVGGAAAMGASPIFVRLAEVGPQASAFWRMALALPFLWLWLRLAERGRPRPSPRFDRRIVLVGVLFAGDLFFWHLAIVNTTVANATFFATTAPVFVVLAAFLLLREAIGSALVLGLALCVAGGAALIGQSWTLDPARLAGDFYGIVTAIFFGAYILAVRHARERHGAARLTFLATGVTAAILLVVALLLEPTMVPRSLGGMAALVALALVSQVGGQGLVVIALGTLPATFSSLVIFLEAVAAAALGWMVLGEALTPVQTLGGVLILAGIWVARPRTAEPAGVPV